VRLYLDSSALVKLVRTEPETAALRRFLRRHRDDGRVTSLLARTEVVRAVLPIGVTAVTNARDLLRRVDQIRLDAQILDDAATLPPAGLRSLNAIHLSCARQLGAELRAVVTYDERMVQAVQDLGLPVATPR
jgi:predicted nucleic acid-binding protein